MGDNSTGQGAPFNMAISTLQRLDRILEDIKITSAGYIPMGIGETGQKIETAIGLDMKIRLIKQFFMQSIPLLKEKQRIELAKHLKEIPNNERWELRGSGHSAKKVWAKYYSNQLEGMWDNFLCLIQIELQKENYFMPPKNDPRFMMGQS